MNKTIEVMVPNKEFIKLDKGYIRITSIVAYYAKKHSSRSGIYHLIFELSGGKTIAKKTSEKDIANLINGYDRRIGNSDQRFTTINGRKIAVAHIVKYYPRRIPNSDSYDVIFQLSNHKTIKSEQKDSWNAVVELMESYKKTMELAEQKFITVHKTEINGVHVAMIGVERDVDAGHGYVVVISLLTGEEVVVDKQQTLEAARESTIRFQNML